MIKFDFENFSKDLVTKRMVFNRMTLDAASKQIDISKATLSRLERKMTPDVITYAKCCQWLEVSLDAYIKNPKNKDGKFKR